MKTVGIYGYGRFGKVLENILSDHHNVAIYDARPTKDHFLNFVSENTLLQQKNIFIAVPINQFEGVVKSIAPKLLPGTTIFDVCSIKLHPVNVMKKYLPKNTGIIATHPLFGPDSINSKEILNFMMHPVRDAAHCYDEWKHFFSKTFNIVELTPDEHDHLAAESQGVVHFVTRFLQAAKLHQTSIDTLGFKQLLKLVENNCNDSWELFSDLQNYNPYSKAMITRLETAFDTVKSKL